MRLNKVWLKAIEENSFKVTVKDNVPLISKKDANVFLDWIAGKGVLLGAEGFKIKDGEWIPLPDCIIDYSSGDENKSIIFHKRNYQQGRRLAGGRFYRIRNKIGPSRGSI
jgi:hypothetical protein